MLNNIRIILINTSHPGNIGASARAMKTMGLSRLYLVSPALFPHEKAEEMASHAADILEKAIVINTFEEAIADCHLVIGTSARLRTIPWPLLTPKTCADKILTEPRHHEIAIVFGREQSGLTNEELHQCHYHVQIPHHESYCSLNLAAALQVIAYEIWVAHEKGAASTIVDDELATAEELEGFYAHLHTVLTKIDFLNPKSPRQLMARLRRLFHRARMDKMEVNILRGVLGLVEKMKDRT